MQSNISIIELYERHVTGLTFESWILFLKLNIDIDISQYLRLWCEYLLIL